MTVEQQRIQYELFLALLETNNTEKAKEILRNAIRRIDRSYSSSNNGENKEGDTCD